MKWELGKVHRAVPLERNKSVTSRKGNEVGWVGLGDQLKEGLETELRDNKNVAAGLSVSLSKTAWGAREVQTQPCGHPGQLVLQA